MTEENHVKVYVDVPELTAITRSLQDISEGLSQIVSYLVMLTDFDASKRKCSLRITGHVYNTEDRP